MEQTNTQDLEARLAAARERTRAAKAKREAAEVESATIREVEQAEIEAADQEAIADAEEKHGAHRIAVVRSSLGCVIVKRPNPLVYKRFRDKGEAKTADLETLARHALVYPSPPKFDAMLQELPAILDHAANKVVELAGFNSKEVGKKS